MNRAVRQVIRAGAIVILGMFAAVVLFMILVSTGCTSFKDDKAGKGLLKVDVEGTITKLNVECGIEETKDLEETEDFSNLKN